jgi:hydrogenase maturation factor
MGVAGPGRTTRTGVDPAGVPPPTQPCEGDTCITCSDEAHPGRILTLPSDPFGLAVVRTAAGLEEVDVSLIGEVTPGQEILIHAGTAIGRVDGTEETRP